MAIQQILAAFGGVVAPPAALTWDAAAMGSAITLSNGNLDAEKATTGYRSVYGTVGKSSGKWQFEVKHLATLAANGPLVGIADKTNLTNVLGDQIGKQAGVSTIESLGWRVDGLLYKDLTAGSSLVAAGTATALNDIIGVTLDLTLGSPEVKLYKNGTLITSSTLAAGKTWFPAASVRSAGKVGLMTTLTYPVSGFTQWG